jgi:hypothetical protein
LRFQNFDIFQFGISFLGGVLGLNITICAIAILMSIETFDRVRAAVIYVIFNIALLVSYPEALVILKMSEFIFVADRLFRSRNHELAKRWLIGNVATVAVNPFLVFSKIAYMRGVTASIEGWNVIGNPVTSAISYLGRVIGLEPAYLSELTLFAASRPLFWLVDGLGIIFAVGLIVFLCMRMRSPALLLIPLIVVALHVLAFARLRPHVYAAVKVMLAWAWLVPVGFACAYASVSPVNRYLIVAAGCLLALGNMETFRRSMIALLEMPTFRSAKEREAVIRVAQSYSGERMAIAIDSNDPISVWYWFQVLDNRGLSVEPLTKAQRDTFRRAILPDELPATADRIAFVLRPQFKLTLVLPKTDLRVERVLDVAPESLNDVKLGAAIFEGATVTGYLVAQ